jgi:hypothetical protein
MDNTIENSEDSILGLEPIFKLKVLIPERMRKEIQANASCATLEQSIKDN